LQVLDGEAEVPVGSPKERALLAVLLLHAGAVVSRERLIDELWGESPPPTAAKALNVHVSQLRKALANDGGDPIATRAHGYMLRIELEQLDATRFERLIAEAGEQAAAGEVAGARRLLQEALALWRGPPLADIELKSSARNELARLEELRLTTQMDRIDCDLALGRHEQLVGELEALVAEHRLHERLRGQLILALYRAGRQADALQAYRAARQTLVDELGLEPSAPLQRLEKAILNQDPSLEAPAEIAAAQPESAAATLFRRRRLALAGAVLAIAGASTTIAVISTRGETHAALSTVPPDSVAIVDPHRDAAAADVPLHAQPAAVAYGAGSFWVATKDDQTLLQIDPRTHRITRTIGLGVEPTTIASAGRYVWVLGPKTLLQFDGETGTLVRTLRLRGTIRVGLFRGQPLPAIGVGTAPDPFDLAAGAGAAWVAFGYGVVARVDANTGALVQIEAGSAHGIAFGDRAAWSISAPAPSGIPSGISRIDARTRAVTHVATPTDPADSEIYGIAAGPNAVWAISENKKIAWKIDPDLVRVTAVIPLERSPADVAVDAEATWLANDDGTVSRIDNTSAAVVRTIPLGRYPRIAYPVDLATGDGFVWIAVH
jgi:DNA-binding SARP family transcriptional activator